MKPVIIITIAFVILFPVLVHAQTESNCEIGEVKLRNGQCVPECTQTYPGILQNMDNGKCLSGLDAQRYRIQEAEKNPGCVQKEYHVIDGKCVPPPNSEEDESTYQPTCAEGDILQNGICIVSNPQPIYAKENSWFSSIFDWLKSWLQ